MNSTKIFEKDAFVKSSESLQLWKHNAQVLHLCINIKVYYLFCYRLLKTYKDKKKWVYLFFYEMSVNQAIVAHVLLFVLTPLFFLIISFHLNAAIIKLSKYYNFFKLFHID